jgi:hypothetical protein
VIVGVPHPSFAQSSQGAPLSIIDGSATPNLIPDHVAYLHLLKAVDERRQRDAATGSSAAITTLTKDRLGLSDAESVLFLAFATKYLAQLNDLDSRVLAGAQLSLGAERQKILQAAISNVPAELGFAVAQKLAGAAQTMKSSIKVYTLQVKK